MDKITFNNIMDKVFDVAAIAGIVFLSYHGKDGWGWLIFLLIIKNG
jgi:hypothetical protein